MMKKWYPEADTVLLHGTIYTVAITCEEVKAGKSDFPILYDGGVAIKDGRIIGVDSSDAMKPFVGEHTQLVDTEGKVIAPGFCESHMHCTFTGNNLMTIDMRPVTSRAEILRLVKDWAEQTPKEKWIEGNSWNNLIWDDERLITCDELDAVCPDHPVFLMGTTFHTALVNSMALKAAGITRDTPDPEGGSIGRFEDGTPNGVLYENSAMGLVQEVIPPKTDAERVEALRRVGRYLNELGITSAIDANLSYDQMRAYGFALKENQLSYRANLMFYLDSAAGDLSYHLRRLDEACTVTGFGNDRLKLNGVKVTLDGIPYTFTAMMREPYKMDPTTCGSSVWTQEEITAFVCKAHEKGWQVGIHTIGDKATDMALEAFEAANEISPVWDRRHYLIHYVFPHEDQWETMRRLNIGAAMQPTIVSCLGEAPLLYEHQARWNQGAGLMFKHGIICGGSSDSPVVSPDPILGMYYAVTRIDETSPDQAVIGPECCVTPRQALIMWTKNSAFFMHDDDKLGSIEVGNLADLVVINHEFLTDDPEDLRTAKVEKTMLGGTFVYEA